MSVASPRLVVLAADDEPVVALVRGLEAHVVVGIERVPVERVRAPSRAAPARDGIGAVRRLLGVDRDPVVDRRVGGDHDRAGAHRRGRLRPHHDLLAVLLDLDARPCRREAGRRRA